MARSIHARAARSEREARAVEVMQALDATAELERIRSAAFDAFGEELTKLAARVRELEIEVARLRADRASE